MEFAMRSESRFVVPLMAALFISSFLVAAPSAAQSPKPARICECGKNPPPPPRDREVVPYAGEPEDLKPYSKFAAPYDTNYTRPNIYFGAARDIPVPTDITEVRIGFFGPIEHNSESVLGLRMLHGAQLAVDEANAAGGYGGKPFKLMLHNDYNNWQAKAVYGDVRPTESAIWGSASDETAKMAYDEKVWAIFGSISSESTHIALRVALRAELPVVSSANTDPTVPETTIPWYFGTMQDDRQQYLTLARHIYTELGLKRVAVLRASSRYGRYGLPKFLDASRRLGHPVVIEQIFQPGDTDFSKQLRVMRSSRPDAVFLIGDELEAAAILKQMRAAGMKQRAFGAFRTLGDTLLKEAGDAAEGFEAVYPYDPNRTDPRWLDFNRRFEARFHEKPEQFASMAFDTMNILLDSICKAGLNRARIHDALGNVEQYDGVTGQMVFDPNLKNTAPLYLGTVHNGSVTYRIALMEKTPAPIADTAPAGQPAPSQTPAPTTSRTPPPAASSSLTVPLAAAGPYARVGEDGVAFEGPRRKPAQLSEFNGPIRIVLFGPDAESVAASLQGSLNWQSLFASWQLLPISSNQSWGVASTALVHALMDQHALAILALDRDSAHLSEQLALKAFVPVVALADDRSLTSNNVPWIFRLPAITTPYSGLKLLHSAERASGANPEKLRDTLASGSDFAGISFSPTGEPRKKAPISTPE
jgi:ABC-type branched-subunit amino acid transport system substrate-binding protein